ncbi:TetR/AcrR family transcriptional regulator [Streptomyces sp. NPDC058239]|uniref:TetR/AcrR family transcriptional regulator n=1 Tax=unclassified Streptomyces TaxID=2593676 RepID=UPI0036631300
MSPWLPVDERAGLPRGSTSDDARTRQSLLEVTVRRPTEREARVLAPGELPVSGTGRTDGPDADAEGGPEGGSGSGPHGGSGTGAENSARIGPEALVAGLAPALHRYLTRRYELALEATRCPELREFFDATGRQFREPLMTLMTAAGSAEHERHSLSVVAWCEGLMFSCAAGAYHRSVPTTELLLGTLGSQAALR